MSVLDTLLGAVLVFAILPEVVHLQALRRGSPRLLAALELAGLVGWAILPAATFSCLGDAIASVVASGQIGSRGCWMALAAGQWYLVGVALGAVALAPVGYQAWRTARAVGRGQLTGLIRRAATPRPVASGASVWVVPSAVPLAYAAGLRHPEAVVSTAVLDGLGDGEAQAVLEHEAAHVALGHPRLLVLGAAVARAYGALPPVRRRYSALRCALEAAADDEAVRVVGRAALLNALTQVVSTHVASAQTPPAASFTDAEHLAYRIQRLQNARGPIRTVDSVVGLVSMVLVGLFAWSACVLMSGSPLFGGELLCVLAVVMVASRPLWAWRHRSRLDTSSRLGASTNM